VVLQFDQFATEKCLPILIADVSGGLDSLNPLFLFVGIT